MMGGIPPISSGVAGIGNLVFIYTSKNSLSILKRYFTITIPASIHRFYLIRVMIEIKCNAFCSAQKNKERRLHFGKKLCDN